MTIRHGEIGKIEEIGKSAERLFREGYCCSEAVVRAAQEVFSLTVSQDVLRAASAFCGGMGSRKAQCGVFSGGVIVLGILAGRSAVSENNKTVRRLSRLYVERLQGAIRHTICQDLLDSFGSLARKKTGCRKLTRQGAEILALILVEREKSWRPRITTPL